MKGQDPKSSVKLSNKDREAPAWLYSFFCLFFPLFLQPSVHNVFIFCQAEDNCRANSKKKLKGPDFSFLSYPTLLEKEYLSLTVEFA